MYGASRNNLIRCVIFLIITGVVVFYLCQVFTFPKSNYNRHILNAFYGEKENTLDGVHFGTSSVARAWIGAMAYEEYGMAISGINVDTQPLVLTKYLMKEVEKTQNPKVFVVELKCNKDPDNTGEVLIRRITDNMRPSINRIAAIEGAIQYASSGDNNVKVEDRFAYYFPIIKYHGRWNNEMRKEDILMQETEHYCKSFHVTKSQTCVQVPQKEAEWTESMAPLVPEMESMLIDLLDYCDTIEPQTIFVITPSSADEETVEQLNTMAALVMQRGYPVLNFTDRATFIETGISYETDFYNRNHMNCLGAEKYTKYLAEYITDNYDLQDHRGDADYKSWEEAYLYYREHTDQPKSQMIQ